MRGRRSCACTPTSTCGEGDVGQPPASGWVRGALYACELVLVFLLLVLALVVGLLASWWGALGMVFAFVLGGVFRDFYNVRIGCP